MKWETDKGFDETTKLMGQLLDHMSSMLENEWTDDHRKQVIQHINEVNKRLYTMVEGLGMLDMHIKPKPEQKGKIIPFKRK